VNIIATLMKILFRSPPRHSGSSEHEEIAPSTMNSASVYLRKGAYFVHPLASSQGGDPCLFIGPVVKLKDGVDSTMLGAAVMQALQASRHDEPWPKQWKGLTKPLVDAAGVKTESAFNKGLKSVRVDLQGRIVDILPTTSKAPGRGAEGLTGKEIRIPLTDAEALGTAVLQALTISD
jgi:hypothetical protein